MATDFKQEEKSEQQENTSIFIELYKESHPNTQDSDFNFNPEENIFNKPEIQGAWWGWCKQIELGKSGGCYCDFDEDDIDESIDIEAKAEEMLKDRIERLVVRVNQFGLIELLDEFEQLSFSVGNPVRKEKLINDLKKTIQEESK